MKTLKTSLLSPASAGNRQQAVAVDSHTVGCKFNQCAAVSYGADTLSTGPSACAGCEVRSTRVGGSGRGSDKLHKHICLCNLVHRLICSETTRYTCGFCSQLAMEDSIDMILQDYGRVLPTSTPHPVVSACTGALLTSLYAVWSLFALPGFRKIPWNLKVPYLPSSKDQTLNTMKLLQGRTGRLADLGSGDGRLVFAASSAGFQCTGFEINSILVTYSKSKASWKGVPSSQATFVNKDFWKTDLSTYNNVTAFLAPGVMGVLGEKLLRELPDNARSLLVVFLSPTGRINRPLALVLTRLLLMTSSL
ncbi:hypothetical protein Q5P01_014362 [Channa striata]|uniref:Uncharacterized protein n=1 Tax=Channa striata TaxID=64152 RepID=A0AA88MH34_CHASR|nr:hypothetical protein Q5P01_014362 [Channa striata]